MSSDEEAARASDATTTAKAIDHLRRSLSEGQDWLTALLEATALWTLPRETREGREYNYFIGGEAFDWQLLAERLCETIDGMIPEGEKEALLFEGRFPAGFDGTRFKDLLGVDKYRGYLNYFYGVIVEEALQMAAEREVHKRQLSNGNQYQGDFSEEAFSRTYRLSRTELFELFRLEKGHPLNDSTTLGETKEFNYWLFEYRMKNSDKAKIASDTRKGLRELHRMMAAWGVSSPVETTLSIVSEV